jgi:uncharacterized protein
MLNPATRPTLQVVTATDVVDETAKHRFLYVEAGQEAQLVYRVDGDRLVLDHTAVPKALGGRGIAGRLVRAAVGRATESGETVVPECEYAYKWLKEHPDEAAAITIDWPGPGEDTSA